MDIVECFFLKKPGDIKEIHLKLIQNYSSERAVKCSIVSVTLVEFFHETAKIFIFLKYDLTLLLENFENISLILKINGYCLSIVRKQQILGTAPPVLPKTLSR